jgi:hypothetical protein
MPEEHQFQALGAEAMGTADDRDRAVIADMYAPAKLADFMDRYRVSSGRGINMDNRFALNRRQHSVQFHHNSFHQVLELVDNVAETWDRVRLFKFVS